jgi:ion channel-forming bestrophin family protein
MTPWKRMGNYLGLSVAMSNPRKAIKRSDKPLGNLPLEILTYLSCYVEEVSANGTLKSPIIYGQISMFPFICVHVKI